MLYSIPFGSYYCISNKKKRDNAKTNKKNNIPRRLCYIL